MHDVKDQIRDYFEQNVERFDLESLPEKLQGANETGHGAVSASPMRGGWLIAGAAAVAVLAVLGGSSLLVGAFRTSAPATGTPTPTTVEQTTDIAASAIPGLGTLTWQRVDGDESTIPINFQADPNGGYISYEGSKVWRSQDAVSWTVLEEASEFAAYPSVTFEDGWAVGWSYGASSQLFEHDGESWVPVLLEAATVPLTSGITWNQGVRFPAESGDVTVIDGSSEGQISWADVYGMFEEVVYCAQVEPCYLPPYGQWDVSAGTYRVGNPITGSTLGVLSMVVEEQTISFLDADSGETVYTVTASADYSTDAIAERLRRGSGLSYQGGWVAVGDSEPQWTAFPWENFANLVAVPEGGFAAYEFVYDRDENRSDSIVRSTVWTSIDGLNWVSNGELPFSDAGVESISVREGPTQLQAFVTTGDNPNTGMPLGDSWISTDGLNWLQDESAFAPHVTEQKTDFGWVAVDAEDVLQFWVSTDGSTWFDVENPEGSASPNLDVNGEAGAARAILYAARFYEAGPRTLWIGTFEPAP